jgi:hypothetical protein
LHWLSRGAAVINTQRSCYTEIHVDLKTNMDNAQLYGRGNAATVEKAGRHVLHSGYLAPTLSCRDGTKSKIQPLLNSTLHLNHQAPKSISMGVSKAVAQQRPSLAVCNGSGAMSGQGGPSRAVNKLLAAK